MRFVTRRIPCGDSKTCFRIEQVQLWQQRSRLAKPRAQSDCEKLSLVYFFNCSRRPRSLDQRGFRNGADVQIGGGVRVGDAFQAIVGPKLIAIWER